MAGMHACPDLAEQGIRTVDCRIGRESQPRRISSLLQEKPQPARDIFVKRIDVDCTASLGECNGLVHEALAALHVRWIEAGGLDGEVVQQCSQQCQAIRGFPYMKMR